MTVPTQSFAAQLGTHQDPRALARGLGHHVGLEAPRGLVLGITQPTTRADGPELVGRPRPVQRTSVQPSFDQRATAETPASFEEHEPALLAVGPASEAPAPTAVRHLPVVQRQAAPSQPLTAVGPDYEPAPLPASTEVILAESEPAEDPATAGSEPSVPPMPRLTLGQARRLGLGAPLSRVPDTSVQRAAQRTALPALPAPAEPVPAVEMPPWEPIFPTDLLTPKKPAAPAPISRPQRIPIPMPLQRTTSGIESQKASAVEPAAAAPSLPDRPALPQGGPSEGTTDVAQEPRATDAAQTDRGSDALTGSDADESASPAAASPPELIAIARLAGPLDLALGNRRTKEPSDLAKGEAEGMDAAALPSLPLAGPTVSRMRAPESDGPPLSGVEMTTRPAARSTSGSETELSGIAASSGVTIANTGSRPALAPRLSAPRPIATSIQRSPEAAPRSPLSTVDRSIPGGLGGLRTSAFSGRADADLAESRGAVEQMPVRSMLTHQLAQVTPQGRQGAELTLQRSEAGRRTENQALSVERFVAAPGAAALPLVRPEARSSQTSTAVMEALPLPAMTWSMQRATGAEAEGAPSEAPGSSPSASQPTSGPGAAAETDDETRMDDLAGKLYDKIRNRLRSELLVDRERAGFLTDLR